MPAFIQNILDAFNKLSSGQIVKMAVAVVATLGLVWGVAQYATRIHYGVLFTGMSSEDAAQVVERLKQDEVPYRLRRGGKVVEVPGSRVDELRMELAAEGLPRGGGVGFEIFDKPAFGLSDFVQNVNYKRALERELVRTIQSLHAVESARVHLALPAESVFADEKQEPSASVMIRMPGNRTLEQGQVQAIAHLVASGVEGMESSRVSVVDSHGRMLTDGEKQDSDDRLSASQLEAKQAMEADIEYTLVRILEPIVGTGKVRATATVELETARVQRVEEKFDPAGTVVRSEQKNRSKSRGGAGASGGVPGTASNIGGGAGPNSRDQTQDSQQSTTNFEINKTVSTIAEPRGGLVRQSVAVVVDYVTPPVTDGADATPPAPQPRGEEEMTKITELVSAAVGIDAERGDTLRVDNMPFDETLNPTAEFSQGLDWIHLVTQIVRFAALPLAVLLIALLVIRPGIAAIRSLRPRELPAAGNAPQTIGEMQARLEIEGQPAAAAAEGGTGLRHKLIEATREDPEAAALIVRGWLAKQAGD